MHSSGRGAGTYARPGPGPLQFVGRAAQDVFLDLLAQFHEVGAVAGHADKQALVVFGMLLGATQDLMADDVELHMENVKVKEGLEEGRDAGAAFLALDDLRGELDVQQGAAVDAFVRQLAQRLEDGRRAHAVMALRGGAAVGQRPAGIAAGGQGGDGHALRHVGGDRVEGRQLVVAELAAVRIDLLDDDVAHGDHGLVRAGIVVAPLGRVFLKGALEGLISLEVGLDGGGEVGHAEALLVEDDLLDRGQRVHEIAHAVTVHAGPGVEFRTAVGEVAPLFHAARGEHGGHGIGQILIVQLFQHVL